MYCILQCISSTVLLPLASHRHAASSGAVPHPHPIQYLPAAKCRLGGKLRFF